MNPIIQSLYDRKSVRVFTEEAVTEEVKTAVLEAAMQAPTAGNQQMYTIIDVTDQSLKDKLAISCDNQPFIANAPLVFVFCVDFQKWYDLFTVCGAEPRKPGVGDLMLGTSDAVIAAQNAVVAAESLGLGSCYIGDILEQAETHRELLHLPQYVMPVCMLVMGYPTEQQKQRPKPQRHKLSDIVCENGYTQKGEKELLEMFAKEAKAGTVEDWAKAFCARKYNSDFSREMGRSVEEYLKLWK